MKDTTQTCLISDSQPLIGGSKVTFSASGQLLFADIPLGCELPKEFEVILDGEGFIVVENGQGHCVCDDDRDAFTAQVFG